MAKEASTTIEELKQIPILQGLPDDQLHWIIEHSTYMEFEDGELVLRVGEIVNEVWFIIEGQVEHYVDVNGRQVHYITFGHDPPSNGVTGALPYSRMTAAHGWSYAKGRLRGVAMDKSLFKELEEVSPELIQRLISNMTERAKWFATRKLQEEKISALGKLSAGLAHELNNPAAAIQRTATELVSRLKNNYTLTSQLLKENVKAKDVEHINDLILREAEKPKKAKQSLMQKMAQEDELVEKLESYGFPDPQTLAETMNEADINPEALEEIYQGLSGETFIPIMKWLCNILISNRVIKEIEDASTRISDLVGAMKSHVYMDRSIAMEPVDVHEALGNTLTLLNHKLRKKNIQVEKHFEDSLPEIMGFGGELNQVWSNLVDNAIDAMDQEGKLTIQTRQDNDRIKVSIIDTGSGIPEEIQNQIFDPFFTTKKQGEGTGIGLDLVKQIVSRHHGDVIVSSESGRTEFLVTLPIVPSEKEINDPNRPTS